MIYSTRVHKCRLPIRLSLKSRHIQAHLKNMLWREEMEVVFVCLKLNLGRKQVEGSQPLLSLLLSQEVLGAQPAALTFTHI